MPHLQAFSQWFIELSRLGRTFKIIKSKFILMRRGKVFFFPPCKRLELCVWAATCATAEQLVGGNLFLCKKESCSCAFPAYPAAPRLGLACGNRAGVRRLGTGGCQGRELEGVRMGQGCGSGTWDMQDCVLVWVTQCREAVREQRTGKLITLQNNFQPCLGLTLLLQLLLCIWKMTGTTLPLPPTFP